MAAFEGEDLDQAGVVRAVAEAGLGGMPEPGAVEDQAVEAHGHGHDALPARGVRAVTAQQAADVGQAVGRQLGVAQRGPVRGQRLVAVEAGPAAAVLGQAEVGHADPVEEGGVDVDQVAALLARQGDPEAAVEGPRAGAVDDRFADHRRDDAVEL